MFKKSNFPLSELFSSKNGHHGWASFKLWLQGPSGYTFSVWSWAGKQGYIIVTPILTSLLITCSLNECLIFIGKYIVKKGI